MKQPIFSTLAIGAVCLASFGAALAAEEGFQSIFNGKDLTGWDGNPKLWSVKDGAIVGQTSAAEPLKGNTFLIWTGGAPADFELRCSYKTIANNDKSFANSGIQYRSKIFDPASWAVGGYQADLEAGDSYSGILYEERMTRGIMAARGEKVVWDKDCKKQVVGTVGKSEEIQAAIKKDGWNDYVIIAQGNHLQHFINGKQTVDVTDECEQKAAKAGVLALQVHAGLPMTVQFKNLRIKPLSSGAVAASIAATAPDLDRVQGDWTVVEIVANGEKVPAGMVASAKLNIKGDKYDLDAENGASRGTIKLRERDNPKSMDVTTDDGTEVPAIYEIFGDTMKVCYALNDAPRPKVFKSEPGSDQVFAIYKRKAK